MIPYALLDLAPIPDGSDVRTALHNAGDLAQHAEGLGYSRFWMAEHHNMPGIASAATSTALAYVGSQTSTIRIGSGGVMLPNHAPLVIAEQFGTLQALYGDRIDLGLGRAPGTDMPAARALRRGMEGADRFPNDVMELIELMGPAREGAQVRAVPGEGSEIPVWILGSSLYGAQLAAHYGLPYAFASHFAPPALAQAIEVYRKTYRPSERHPAPYFMMAMNVFGAETDEEAAYLRTSVEQAFVNLRSGRPGRLPKPMEGIENKIDPGLLASARAALKISATGTAETMAGQLSDLLDRYQPDEVIFTSGIHDHQKRKRSIGLAAEAMAQLGAAKDVA